MRQGAPAAAADPRTCCCAVHVARVLEQLCCAPQWPDVCALLQLQGHLSHKVQELVGLCQVLAEGCDVPAGTTPTAAARSTGAVRHRLLAASVKSRDASVRSSGQQGARVRRTVDDAKHAPGQGSVLFLLQAGSRTVPARPVQMLNRAGMPGPACGTSAAVFSWCSAMLLSARRCCCCWRWWWRYGSVAVQQAAYRCWWWWWQWCGSVALQPLYRTCRRHSAPVVEAPTLNAQLAHELKVGMHCLEGRLQPQQAGRQVGGGTGARTWGLGSNKGRKARKCSVKRDQPKKLEVCSAGEHNMAVCLSCPLLGQFLLWQPAGGGHTHKAMHRQVVEIKDCGGTSTTIIQ